MLTIYAPNLGMVGGIVPPTQATLTGPSSGSIGSASTDFTITLDHPALTDLSFPITYARGTVSSNPVVIHSGEFVGSFTITPNAPGSGTVLIGAGTTGLIIVVPSLGFTASPGTITDGGGNDIIKDATILLAGILKQYASQRVTYVVENVGSVELPATFGSKLLKTHDDWGHIKLEWTDLDFIIPSANLIINGRLIEPARGHYIFVNQGGQTQQYQVMPFGLEPPWRWSDPYLVNYRVHTKLINVEDN